MLGIDAFDTAMLLADTEIIEAAVEDILARTQLRSIIDDKNNISTLVQAHINKWKNKISDTVTGGEPTSHLKEEMALYQEVIHWQEDEFVDKIEPLLAKLKPISNFHAKALSLVEGEYVQLNPMLPQYFCHQWYHHLMEEMKNAKRLDIENKKEAELKALYERIEMIQNMDDLGPDDEFASDDDKKSIAGRIWDMSAVSLSKSDWSVMKNQADFLKKHPTLQDIAQQLGRMAAQNADPDELNKTATVIKYHQELSDQATDDIVGIHESDDLSRLLPNETLFLAYPELEVIFYKHLVDKRLLNYKMQGKAIKRHEVEAMQAGNNNVEQNMGPFIVCVDASGSMVGFPEQCAKAIAFALMQVALAEDRDCFVVLFSTDYISYQLTRPDGLREASDFLSYTFHGGTDLEPAINAAIEQMKGQQFQNADLVVISDFIAPKSSSAQIKEVEKLKLNKNRFNAICLSKYGNPKLLKIFDQEWNYHPNLSERLVSKK